MYVQALESYDLVKLKTLELERIHTTSMILRQLRQFVHCRAQLEYLLKTASEEGGLKGKKKKKNNKNKSLIRDKIIDIA